MTVSGVVDLHAHVVLDGAFNAAGIYGPEHGLDVDGVEFFRVGEYTLKPIPYRGSVFMDVERRLAEMDRVGIDRQMLSPNPLTFLGGVESAPAIDFAQATNDSMAALVAAHPERLLGAAQLPMQDPDAAIVELERAICNLGLVAGYIGTDYGIAPDDLRFEEFYGRVAELDVPLFVHGVTNDGRGPVADSRLRRFGLDLIVGYTYEETLAAAAFVLGGVLDRHQDLDVCLSHGGGAIAFLAQRFDSMASFLGHESDFVASLSRLWFDSHLEPGLARDLVIDTVGIDRMVYGTNFGGWDTPAATDDFDAALTENAHRLLRLEAIS
ncbi:MAG: amidohydrolase family protein [Ilumatobacter sp.]|nr:amidohydrolase family protein [Ilumatobacter sp.]